MLVAYRKLLKVKIFSTVSVTVYVDRAVDPHSLYTDPDPAVFLNADPDPDPDPDPGPGPGPA